MRRYYISYGGEDLSGPYVESQIRSMWGMGSIRADALICQEGKDQWVPIQEALDDWDYAAGTHPDLQVAPLPVVDHNLAAQQRLVQLQQAQAILATERRSGVIAFLLSLLLPGLGQMYAGRTIMGMFYLGSTLLVSLFTLGFGYPVCVLVAALISIYDADRWNTRRAQELGVYGR